ncbi:hypothetical protein CANMA_001096 [Candida margitis]|uniref:uncharacterized protein n=1 Tax=Candida margitis TaxID=1775924 RepID=UPI00222770C1|nr:uncharacterized protein CANMA_001096 [Candida margitis]KAI5969857.1 hypothetical protein CANMA_001096 [Candida margitis]
MEDTTTSTRSNSESSLRSQQLIDRNEPAQPRSEKDGDPKKHDQRNETNGNTNGRRKQSGSSNGRRISSKFRDMNSSNGSSPLIDTSSIKSYYPVNNSWQSQSPSQKYSTQRLTSSGSDKSPSVYQMSNNQSDSSIKTPRYYQHKRKSTSSSASSGTTPPAVSKSSDNLRMMLDKDRITPPLFSRDDGGSGYFNLDRSKWKGGAPQSIINGSSGKSDRLKSSVVNDSSGSGLLNSPWFRDLKGNSNASANGSSANVSTPNLHTQKIEHLRKEQKNRLVDQFLNSSKKIPPSPGGEVNGSRYFNEDMLPSSLSNSHVNLSALSQSKLGKGGVGVRGASEWKKPPDDFVQNKDAVEQVRKGENLQRLLNSEINLDEKQVRLEKQEEKLEYEEKKVEEEAPELRPQAIPQLPQKQQQQLEQALGSVGNTAGNNNTLPAYASEELVNNVLSNGGFRFEYDTKHVIEDDKLVNYLINIDNVLEELEKRKHNQQRNQRHKHLNGAVDDDDRYGDLINILGTISEKVLIKSKGLIYSKTNPAKATILQLDLVSQYLKTLGDNMHQLRQELVNGLSQTRDKNRSIITDNLSKLNEIDSQLNALEATANRNKDKVNQQKQMMKNEVNEKLTLLEEINKKIDLHNQNKRNKRIIRSNVVLAGLIMVVGIYFALRR